MASEPVQFPPGFLEEDKGPSVVACCAAFIALEVVFVSLRFWARKIKKIRWGWDDAFYVLAALFSMATTILCLVEVYIGGVGRHAAALKMESPEKLVVWAKFAIIIPITYFPSVAFPKLSILALYLRIFEEPAYQIVCWATALFIGGNCIGAVIPAFFICIPLEYWWNKNLPGGGNCIDVNAWYRWPSIVNIATDLVMLAIPIPAIITLHTSKRVKAGLAATFLLGSIGFITAIVRFIGFFTEDMAADPTWVEVKLIWWTIMECQFYLFAASLISCKPLLRPIRDKLAPFTKKWGSWGSNFLSKRSSPKNSSYGVQGTSLEMPKREDSKQLEDGSSERQLWKDSRSDDC
ncbi:hypothetical protein K469DRAFT_639166 [Zopfia rhizophila CBS 207.26]|uniref:Rhodopsin domain-containing protein n=1 Tax=Zopfia rhizophila CBS 207.26 TaxID=1314779 RepID=A0A6A6DMQ5_9PEZI|nr:hypothetical protein K469DRAFT_639166 [Zopfia rhizophila CBS 207.26]